jgi:hypothetical protein
MLENFRHTTELPPTTHKTPRTHHKFTAKTPPEKRTSFKTTLKNARKKRKKAPANRRSFFSY